MLARKRLLPTGYCWCGCGEEVGVRYFFKPGHDKQAEARLIMEVFGGIPQFLHAFGRGPDHEGEAPTDATWVYWALRLAGLPAGPAGTNFVFEYLDEKNRTGRYLLSPDKRKGDGRRLYLAAEVDLTEGYAAFTFDVSHLRIPLVDLDDVRKNGDHYVVRLHGTFEKARGQLGGVEYFSLARG